MSLILSLDRPREQFAHDLERNADAIQKRLTETHDAHAERMRREAEHIAATETTPAPTRWEKWRRLVTD